MKTGLRAEWIVPMTGDRLRDGAVVFEDGWIVAVGPGSAVRRAHPDAAWVDLGQSVLLPGLVNAHTHLELSEASPGDRPVSLGAWLTGIVSARTGGDPVESARRGAIAGRAQCLNFGVSTVGDITRFASATREVLRDGPLRVVSFGEFQALGARRGLLEERLGQAVDARAQSAWLRIGVSPHAPYTVEPAGYRRALEVARQRGMGLCTHLAESRGEWAFLREGTGEFRALWDFLGAWDDAVPRSEEGPIHLAQALGLLDDPRVLLAHVNYGSDAELDLLASGSASVVWCPRTHGYFGHPPHRFREMLERGINVCIGTDSCASSPDLNVLEDLRGVHRAYPEVSAAELFTMVTTRPARALGMEREVGSIAVGKRADVVVFGVSDGASDPLREVLESGALPLELWIAGAIAMTRRGKGRVEKGG